MLRFTCQCLRVAGVAVAVALFQACGGGGAAPPSAPLPPTGTGNPPSGPSTPTQPPPPASPPPQTPPPPSPPAATLPSTATILTPDRTFSPSAVTIAVNGTVTWQAVDDDHDIRFTSAAPPGGSLGELEEGSSATRSFPAAGTYDFECLRHRDKGMRGKIVVEAAPAAPPPSTPAPPPPPPSGSTVTVTTPDETFSPSDVTISTGGSVTWQFSETRHNVTFTGTPPSGGNIPDQEAGTSASRTFTAPGTYNYLCTRHSGMTGRVVVQ